MLHRRSFPAPRGARLRWVQLAIQHAACARIQHHARSRRMLALLPQALSCSRRAHQARDVLAPLCSPHASRSWHCRCNRNNQAGRACVLHRPCAGRRQRAGPRRLWQWHGGPASRSCMRWGTNKNDARWLIEPSRRCIWPPGHRLPGGVWCKVRQTRFA